MDQKIPSREYDGSRSQDIYLYAMLQGLLNEDVNSASCKCPRQISMEEYSPESGALQGQYAAAQTMIRSHMSSNGSGDEPRHVVN
jgi:hypothetical protein